MRDNARCCFERHSMTLLGRSVIAGLLVLGIVGIGTGSGASIHSRWLGWWSKSTTTTTQSIIFTSTQPNPAVVGGTYTPTATGGASGNPVAFSVDPTAKGDCTISGGRVTFIAVGTCVIDANQAGSTSYAAATQVQQSFAVVGSQSITFTSTPPNPAVAGAPTRRPRRAEQVATRSASRSIPRPREGALFRVAASPSLPSGPA